MKSKIAGVALAAVMVCGLGGVQRASAATVTQDYRFFAADVTGSFTATFDPTLAAQGPIALDAFSVSLPGDYAPAYLVAQSGVEYIGDDCSSYACGLGGVPQFFLIFKYDIDGRPVGPGQIYFNTIVPDLPGLIVEPAFLVPVALPASAPTFGAALLALAGIGYAMRHRNDAKAV